MIFLWILIGAALLAITLVLCFRVMFTAMTRAVERRHRAMEAILETRRPPEAWVAREPPDRAKRRALRELDRLIDYAEHSRLVESEETRTLLIQQLSDVRKEWSETDPS